MNSDIQLQFLRSALTKEGAKISTNRVANWIKEQNQKVNVEVNQIPFNDICKWQFDFNNVKLHHTTGKFFSVEGINVKTNIGNIPEWDQPIINQPEIGYLGFITKIFNGVLHFLVQAKIEPGNINYVQLSPTIQATRSNYMQIHKGKKPLYLDYFKFANSKQILLDQLQSEQGSRFLKKRNRNIIILTKEEIPEHENFLWLTLGQIKDLMAFDNLVNMDTRTVIAGIEFGNPEDESYLNQVNHQSIGNKFLKSSTDSKNSFHKIDQIISFLTTQKSNSILEIEKTPLNKLRKWKLGNYDLVHEENKYFKVIGVEVKIENREVTSWHQPMIQPMQEGLCAFILKEINGTIHLAVQAKVECGNHDIVEFAPTVQCLTGNYRETKAGSLPFLEYVLNASKNQIIYDTMQSEEGGRFYKEQNRNLLIYVGEKFSNKLPDNYVWMTLSQILWFLKFNNFFNVQARSLIAAINYCKNDFNVK